MSKPRSGDGLFWLFAFGLGFAVVAALFGLTLAGVSVEVTR